MKTIQKLLIVILIFCATACGNPGDSNNSDNISKTITEAPQIDIHTATFMGDINVIKQHIAAGSDLDVKEPSIGSSPLITAAVFGKNEIAKELIKAGADVNLQNNEGSTALHSAAFLCRTEIVEMLVNHGADLSLKNKAGSTALESVAGPFSDVKGIYDLFNRDLGPLGLKLDYSELEKTRPIIAELLK